MKMDPITLGVVLACLVAGFGAGWGLHPDAAVEALEAQSVALSELQEGQRAVLEQAGKPIVIDAELRSTLAEVPVQCREDAWRRSHVCALPVGDMPPVRAEQRAKTGVPGDRKGYGSVSERRGARQ